jgi:hypothetical protein
MSMYGLLRVIHGYWRWAVLVSGVVTLVRAVGAVRGPRAWTPGDERASRTFVGALDVQVLLGLLLYFGFSPFWPAVRDSFEFALRDRSARFFGMEHETAMLLGFVAAHVGRVRSRKATDPTVKHGAILVSTLVFFLFVSWAIPWPWRSIGRPLFRVSW